MRATPPERGQFLAPPLIAAVHETLARGEQAMLFLNRRGYAPLTLCRALRPPAWRARTAPPGWSSTARGRLLQCHHCGHAEPIPPACPVCGAEHSLAPVGPGVERITEEAAARCFPRRAGW